jgi:hypothetical protein
MPRSALGADSPENEFAFAKNSLVMGARSRNGHVVPIHVLDVAADVADEMVMLGAFRLESRGAAPNRHFTHQIRLHQVPQIVISCGPGTPRIHSIYGLENFRRRVMPVVFHQERHDAIALRSAPQPGVLHRQLYCLGVHLCLDYI